MYIDFLACRCSMLAASCICMSLLDGTTSMPTPLVRHRRMPSSPDGMQSYGHTHVWRTYLEVQRNGVLSCLPGSRLAAAPQAPVLPQLLPLHAGHLPLVRLHHASTALRCCAVVHRRAQRRQRALSRRAAGRYVRCCRVRGTRERCCHGPALLPHPWRLDGPELLLRLLCKVPGMVTKLQV